MWTVYAESYDNDSDFTNGTKTVRVRFNDSIILTYVRPWVVLYNDPAFTNITMKIYSDNNGSKGTLLYSSTTTHLKADIATLDNAVREIYFYFDHVPMDANNYYHFCLSGTSSGFSPTSHIAWKTSYPFPVYSIGTSALNQAAYPLTFCAIGADV